jgi:hypothetical protein
MPILELYEPVVLISLLEADESSAFIPAQPMATRDFDASPNP